MTEICDQSLAILQRGYSHCLPRVQMHDAIDVGSAAKQAAVNVGPRAASSLLIERSS